MKKNTASAAFSMLEKLLARFTSTELVLIIMLVLIAAVAIFAISR